MNFTFVQANAARLPLASDSVDLVFCSPPYLDARTYGIGAQWKCQAWIDWMLTVLVECQRVCRGPVFVVCAGVTRKRNYQPGPEGLLYEWWKRGGSCQSYRPVFWHRVGIPGSGGADYLRADVEYVLCFKRPGPLPYFDLAAVGHPPKWAPGGEMSYRDVNGARKTRRVNQWGHSVDSGATVQDGDFTRSKGKRPSHKVAKLHGSKEVPPVLANPGNLLHTNTGGGQMGHDAAHKNEAPYPEALCEPFIRAFSPPGGTVLDPFSGSGTTVAVAHRYGRNSIGIDLRLSQCQLGLGRLQTTQQEMFA